MLGIFNRGYTVFELGKPLRNLCSSHCLLCRSHLNVSKVCVAFFLSLKKMKTCCFFKFAILLLCHNCKCINTCILQGLTQQSHALESYSIWEITWQAVLCLHLVVEVRASSSTAILWSVQKPFDHTT